METIANVIRLAVAAASIAISILLVGLQLFGDLPALSGATIGSVLTLVFGVPFGVHTLMRMGWLEMVHEPVDRRPR